MANEYNIISDEALDALCGAIKGIANAGGILDDTGVAMDKTYSSFKIQEELDKKIEGDNVVKKDDIVTVLDDTVTDEDIPSAKAVVDELNTKANSDDVPTDDYIKSLVDGQITANSVDYVSKNVDLSLIPNMSLIKSTYFGNWVSSDENNAVDPNETNLATVRTRHANCPTDTMYYLIFTIITDKSCGSDNSWNNIAEKKQIAIECSDHSEIYVRSHECNSPTWSKWQKVCTTTVADVPMTDFSLDTSCDGVYEKGDKNANNCWYAIRNGWCIVHFDFRCLQTMAGYKCVFTSLPKPIGTIANVFMSNDIEINEGDKPLIIIVGGDGMMEAEGGKLNARYIGTVSYPVAE